MLNAKFTTSVEKLIDNLKSVCTNFGLGGDGNEYKVITQIFLYKFMNDKFGYEIKKLDKKLSASDNWELLIENYNKDEYDLLLLKLDPEIAKFKKEHFISYLHNRQNEKNFAKLFDDTLLDISLFNNEIFSVSVGDGSKVKLFDEISNFIVDTSKKNDFCIALINQLSSFSFEKAFEEKFDFFSYIFEYLIKDYNKDGGGKYAEYFTPRSVSKIISKILIDQKVENVTCYDPSAGSGTLLMSLANEIGTEKCSIFSQDISQKSSSLLRLNLVLNNLVHSIQNVMQENTLRKPLHKDLKGLKKFDYIVSNPPFKLNFSSYRDELDSKENKDRFFAGIPKIPPKEVDKMPIYLLFIQHILFSLSLKGKSAIVVPTVFINSKQGIPNKIINLFIEKRILKGVVTMPSNIFATTGTSVSIVFLDKNTKDNDKIVLIDGSNLGDQIEVGNKKMTVLSKKDEEKIINGFKKKIDVEDFISVVNFKQIIDKNLALNASHYFPLKFNQTKITQKEFEKSLVNFNKDLEDISNKKEKNIKEINKLIKGLKFE